MRDTKALAAPHGSTAHYRRTFRPPVDSPRLSPGEERRGETDRHERESVLRDFERDDLRRRGGADVGAHDHADGLMQGHDPSRDETHYQNRGHRRGIEHRCDDRARDRAEETVTRNPAKEIRHALPGNRLQSLRHLIDTEQKQRQAAEKPHQQRKPVDVRDLAGLGGNRGCGDEAGRQHPECPARADSR